MDGARRQRVVRHSFQASGDAVYLYDPEVRRVRDGGACPEGYGDLDRYFSMTPELVGIGTREGRILQVNDTASRVLGYEAGELVGTSIWDLVHPEARDACEAAAGALFRGGVTDVEIRMRHKDGSDRWVCWNAAIVKGQLFAVGRDVTEKRLLEQSLTQAREAAEAAHRAKSEFLAGMSHEIRTPMTAILGFADLLTERWKHSNAPAEDREALQTIKRNGDLLLGLITDILDLAKIEAERTQLMLAACSPAQLVADVMGLMHVRAEAQGLSLDVEFLTPIPASITTDAIRLRQILINLIGNAIKFTDRGGVRLRVRLARDGDGNGDGNFNDNGEGDVSSGGSLVFEVVDTGIGIRDEDIARLFQPFFRVDASQTRRYGGTGLGLALSLRLAERLRGTISARSRSEGGSAFTLTLPVDPVDPVTVASNHGVSARPHPPVHANGTPRTSTSCAAPAAPKRPCRVLLAEDNRDSQRVMSLRLAVAGFEVTAATNGQIAVDLAIGAQASGQPFDVILMDMQMPVLDGYEATRTLRGAGYRHPIIAVTAHAMTEDRDECLRFGCDDYLAKPIDWPRLTGMIASYAQSLPACATA